VGSVLRSRRGSGEPRRPARLACLVVVAVMVATAACGIPISRSPTAIAKNDVPFHLLDPVTPTTQTPDIPTEASVPETVFLVQGQHLVGVLRDVRVPATLTQILTALLDGPTAAETTLGLQSFLTAHTPVTATVTGDIATVDFTTSPVVVVNTDETLAIAQVVFTATQQNGVKGVVLEIGGVPTPVPGGNGVQVNGPVSRSTYAPQAPLS
jgi:hypothetical protein